MRDLEYLNAIPEFKSMYGVTGLSHEFIMSKLRRAYNYGIYGMRDREFLMVSRGEGDKRIVEYVLSEEFFVWGLKCKVAGSRNKLIQELFDPNVFSKEFLIELLDEIDKSFAYYIKNKDTGKWHTPINIKAGLVEDILQVLRREINNTNNVRELIDLKSFLCICLHLLNRKEDSKLYVNNKTLISTQRGLYRHNTAKEYAKGRRSDNSNYVVLDYWIRSSDLRYTFYAATRFYEFLKKHNIVWFNEFKKSLNYEVLVKYTLFPHRLVGYYYYEDDSLSYYYINPFYVEKWQTTPKFNIGEDIYIEQDLNSIEGNFPYNIIYSLDDNLDFETMAL